MPIVADASIAIRGDMSGFNQDLQKTESAVGGFANRVSTNIKKTFSARNLLGAFGLAYGASQLVQFAGDAAQAYGELEQTVRTIDGVFGDSAAVIHEWGETAAETAGMSQQTFMSSAAVMGETLSNMGFSAEEAAEKTTLLLDRAADLAIAFGKRPQDALLAITAAMRGERDTIEKFGVAIKQVDVNARVAALGLDTSTAAAKKNAEAMAVVDLVLEQSAEHAQRFAESQDDIAVKMAVTNARWDNFVAKDIGGAIASIQLGAFKVADAVGDELDKLGTHFGDHFQTIKTIAEESGVTWEEAQKDIVQTMSETGKSFEEVTEGMTRDAKLAAAAQVMELPKGIQAMQDALRLGGPVVADEWDKVEALQQAELDQMVKAAKQAGIDSIVEFADSILDGRQDAIDAIEQVVTGFEEEISKAELIAAATSEETIAALAAGLADPDGAVREATRGRIAVIVSELNKLGPAGAAAAAALLAALTNGISDVTAGALLRQKALQLAGIITAPLMRSEPKDPLSPMKGMTHWGRDYIGILSNDMLANLGTASAASRALAGALVPSLPTVGMAGSSGVGGLAMAGNGNTYVLHVNGVQYEVATADEMLEKLQELGVMSDGRLQ